MKLEEKINAWKDRWRHCDKCSIGRYATHKVFSKGYIKPDILLLGEAPGKEEDKTGIPFVGRSGKLLGFFLFKFQLRIEELIDRQLRIFTVNTVACRPCDKPNGVNRVPNEEELENCRERLIQLFHILDFKVIVCLGRTAAKWTETTETYKKYRCIYLKHPSYWLRTGGKNSEHFNSDLVNFVDIISSMYRKKGDSYV